MSLRKRSISVYLFVVTAGLLLFQTIPIVGLLPAVLLSFVEINAFVVYALLVHAFLVLLFIEAAIGRVPRWLMIVPVFVYGEYYGAYFGQARAIEEETAKMNLENAGKVLDFDPDKMSLVFDNMGDLELFVAHYKVPVVYFRDEIVARNNKSARLVPASQCSAIKSFDNGAAAYIETTQYFYQTGLVTKDTAPCVLIRPEQPPNPLVYVRRVPDEQKRLAVHVRSIEILFDGKPIGSHRSLLVFRIPPILRHIGCGFSDANPSWRCFGLLSEDAETIGSEAKTNDRVGYTSPVSDMLAIARYTNEDILHFAGYPSNAAAVALAQSRPRAK